MIKSTPLKFIFFTFTHLSVLALGFAIGIYVLPILTAPPSPSESDIALISNQAQFKAEFTQDLTGSDALHWGEGQVTISANYIALLGELAPGPDYKLYLSPKFVQTEAEFEALKSTMKLVGDVKTFENFMVKVEPSIDVAQFNTVIIWCETFNEFITAAQYR